MCGISGVYEYRSGKAVSDRLLRGMLDIIYHRGPDDEGIYIDKDLAIGMRRLSIIDLTTGQQPIFNEDKSVVVVFNGEIYNFLELRAQLQQRGHTFATVSDTEVIVHLYEEFGDDCVHKLRGMFGLAVWDIRRRRLLLARDRLGIKPLYYTSADGRLVFGSEIKAILQHPEVRARLDIKGLSHFLSLKYVPSPQTMFAGILSLPPGHLLICEQKGMTVRSYWDLAFTYRKDQKRSEEEYAEQLEEILRESIKLHLISDVPFGAFLSGGLDSSTIVALMSEVLRQPVKTFSVGFEGEGEAFSELPFARLVAKHCQTDHHEIFIRPQHFIDLAEKIVWHLDQPIADDASLANYMVAKLASQHVKMVLTGEGGDELFAGYARYVGERFSPLFRYIPQFIKSLTLEMSNHIPGLRRPKLALYALCQDDEVSRLTNWFPLFNQDMKAELLSSELKSQINGTTSDQIFALHLQRTDATDVLNRMLYVDTKLWLPDDLLARGDKTSMAVSLEARVPLLDHKVVEFAASLPPHLKLNGLTRKYLLRKVSRAWLPAPILDRKKKGFPMPLSIWFRKEARPFVRDLLSPTTIRRRGLFSSQYVEKLLNEHEAGTADYGSLVWSLLSVELWHRLFLDGTSQARSVSRSEEGLSSVSINS